MLREVNVSCCFCSRYDLTVSPFCALSLGFTCYDPSLALNTLYWRSYCILMSPRGQLHCLQCQGPISPKPVGVWISSFLMDLSDRMCHHLRNIIVIRLLFFIMIYINDNINLWTYKFIYFISTFKFNFFSNFQTLISILTLMYWITTFRIDCG